MDVVFWFLDIGVVVEYLIVEDVFFFGGYFGCELFVVYIVFVSYVFGCLFCIMMVFVVLEIF